MMPRNWRALAAACAVLAAGPALDTTVAAQERHRKHEECRCVDAEGNPIERCRCLVMPDVPAIVTRVEAIRARPRLGISIDVRQEERYDAEGALVTDVMEGGPAEAAGIRPGDVIVSVNGRSLLEPLDPETEDDFDLDASVPVQRLLAIVRDLDPGDEVEVEFLRDGERHTVTVEARELSDWGTRGLVLDLDELPERLRDLRLRFDEDEFRRRMDELEHRLREAPDVFERHAPGGVAFWRPDEDEEAVFAGPGYAFGALARVDGVELMDMKPGLEPYFGTDRGVLVTDVEEDAELGLEPGDVILEIGHREVRSAAHARRILRSYEEGEEIVFRLLRKGQEMTVRGRMD